MLGDIRNMLLLLENGVWVENAALLNRSCTDCCATVHYCKWNMYLCIWLDKYKTSRNGPTFIYPQKLYILFINEIIYILDIHCTTIF